MKKRSFILLLIFLILLTGVFLYATTRSENLRVNQWIGMIGHGRLLHDLQTMGIQSWLPLWVINTLPDACWMMALTLTILMIWNFKLNQQSLSWVLFGLGVGLAYEVLQKLNIISGTFDAFDLVGMSTGAALPVAYLLVKDRLYKKRSLSISQTSDHHSNSV